MLFTEVVAASAAVGATRARTAKAATLAALLRAATPAEVEPATAWLAGEARQGRIGTGWRTLSGSTRRPRPSPRSPSRPSTPRSTRSPPPRAQARTKRRAELLHGLFAAATREEQRFLTALLGGELRHGALEGVMLEAVATAAEVPAAVVRRAFMLSGRPPRDRRARPTTAASRARGRHGCRSAGRSGRCSPPRRFARRGARRPRPGRHRRVQARRRPHPGAPRRRRRARLDPHARARSPGRARAGRAGAGAARPRVRARRRDPRARRRRPPARVPGHDEPLRQRRGSR